MRIQDGVIDKGVVNIWTVGFPTEVCVIGPLSNDGQLGSYQSSVGLVPINALVFRELSRNGLLGSARDRYRQVGIAEMICQDWANRSALLTNEQRGKSFRVLAEESYMTSEWQTIVALVVRTGPSSSQPSPQNSFHQKLHCVSHIFETRRVSGVRGKSFKPTISTQDSHVSRDFSSS